MQSTNEVASGEKTKPEDSMFADGIKLSQKELASVGKTYQNYYQWRSFRSGLYTAFRNYDFERYLTMSRELFWNSLSTESTDFQKLGLELAIPFARKESLDFLSRLVSLNVKPHIIGDNLDSIGIKILQGIYKKWAFKSNDKVETFWDLLYGIVNGTVCNYIGYDNTELNRRYLKSYDFQSGAYELSESKQKPYGDVSKELIPIEDIFLPKIYEKNVQKQGRLLWKTQMEPEDFHAEFDQYPMAKYVFPGMRIAEDSLFFRLLGGTGTTTARKIEVIREYDWIADEYKIVASGILLNRLGTSDGSKFDTMPMPFDHKMGPFTWGTLGPLDAKLAYGLSIPFQSKDPHKILNTSYCVTPDTKILTRDLRWVEAGSLNIGDKIMGFEEFSKKSGKKGRGSTRQRHHEEATVTNTGRMIAPVYKVILEDGTELKCTGNHRWLTWNWTGHGADWMRTDEMQKHISNRKNGLFLPKYFDVIEKKETYNSGYLGGLFDGEGSLSLGTSLNKEKASRGVQISFAQQDNEAFRKTLDILKKEGYDYHTTNKRPQKEGAEPCNQTYLRGGFKEVARFLMETRPERIIKENWGRKKIEDMILAKQKLVEIVSAEYLGDMEIITLESSSKTYIAEGFGAHNTMLVERELRAVDPAILSSDIESPEFIFGQHKVIQVNDVNAYKEMKLSEPSNQYFAMMNSLQSQMSANTQGGDSKVMPSRQPDSARAVMTDNMEKQQSMANAVTLYYDLIRQRVLLVLKTALQFYTTDKYANTDKNNIRNLLVTDMPLSGGGIGNVEIRIVKEKKNTDMQLFLEAIKKSITDGKQTELIDVPISFLQDLEFYIERIELEPETTTDIELASFVANVITPLTQVYLPLGLVDPSKMLMRHLEKMGESVSDYVSDSKISQMMSGKSAEQPQAITGAQENIDQTGGALLQSNTGTQNGLNQGGVLTPKFGSHNAKPLPLKKI